MKKKPLLRVESLQTILNKDRKQKILVSDVSFAVAEGETLAIIGESGSGKTTLALSLVKLLSKEFSVSGRALLGNIDLLSLSPARLRQARGKEIALVFQDPDSALNPVFTIGDQVAEVFEVHEKCSREAAEQQAIEMLNLVGIPRAALAFDTYPHQISGGMKQRVMIAIAMSVRPKLIILDEPTTALDLTVQKEILMLIKDLQRKFKMTMIIISHDMGVVAEMADHVAVMYASYMIEYGSAVDVFDNPIHPYTRALFAATPSFARRKMKIPVVEWSPLWKVSGTNRITNGDHWAVC